MTSAKKLGESMQDSVRKRKAMVKKFGFVPMSVLKLSRGSLSKSMFVYQNEVPTRTGNTDTGWRERVGREKADETLAAYKEVGYKGTVGYRNNEAKDRKGLSIMPAELVDFFVKYYTVPGQTYVDPFMGQGIQMQVAKLRGLHYLGMDASEEFVRYIQAIAERINDGETKIEANLGDSRFPEAIPDGVGDFSFHSPPYWDIEFYGTEEAQLGHGQSYPDFLEGMHDVAKAWLPKHKPGAYHVVNVNDFRRDGRFYSYHADTIAFYLRAGWELHDQWIIEGLVGGLPKIFGVNYNKNRIAPKVHEFAIVFRRPS